MAENNVDKEIWEAKDRRIVKMSCLNRATDIAIAIWTHPAVKELQVNPDNLKNESAPFICELANVFVDWVYGKNQPNQQIPTPIPVPTLEQKQIFEQLAKESGLSYEKVVAEIFAKKHSLVVENAAGALNYLKGLNK